jgi:hypothetical protein
MWVIICYIAAIFQTENLLDKGCLTSGEDETSEFLHVIFFSWAERK